MGDERRRCREPLVMALFLLGAAVFTYPLVVNLRTAVMDHFDPLLDAWSLAWVAHQLPRDPFQLFQANRFYPETGSLAFHDPTVGLGAMLAPIQWTFGEPVLTLNLGVLFSIALSGYGAYLLGADVAGSKGAGAVAGSIFAFNSYRIDHLAHVQLQSAGFIPLLYLCLRRFAKDGRLRHAVGVAAFLWLTSATCAYYGMFTWILLAVAVPYELWRTASIRRPKRILALSLALSVSALAYLPLARPLMRLRADFGVERPLSNLKRASARPGDYLRSGSHLHQALGLPPSSPERTLFPGLLAIGLCALALARPNRNAGLLALVGLISLWASLGPAWGLYRVLHAAVPGLSGVRVPPRIAIYVLLAVAVLAAQGAALLLRRTPARARAWAVGSLAVIPLLEAFSGAIAYSRAPAIPEVYAWVARLPEGTPLIELPLPEVERQHENAVYLYWSTTHFLPLANGYGTVVPPVYAEIASELEDFPHAEGISRLAERGFRYVLFHRDRYLRAKAAELEGRLDRAPGLSAVHRTENVVVYEILGPPPRQN